MRDVVVDGLMRNLGLSVQGYDNFVMTLCLHQAEFANNIFSSVTPIISWATTSTCVLRRNNMDSLDENPTLPAVPRLSWRSLQSADVAAIASLASRCMSADGGGHMRLISLDDPDTYVLEHYLPARPGTSIGAFEMVQPNTITYRAHLLRGMWQSIRIGAMSERGFGMLSSILF